MSSTDARVPNYMSVPLMLATLVGVSIFRGWWMAALMALPIFFLTLHSFGVHAARLRRHAREVDELHLRTIEALAMAIDAKDNGTHQHLQRVVIYAEAIGREMGLPHEDLKGLRAAALLHDIGKLAVPEYIISKPGRLTSEEFERMKIHTVVGAEILERVKFPYPVVPVVRAHHERWNGSGYPGGLKGHEIPIGARILAVVDSFDALSSDRQYRRALSHAGALAMIKKDTGVLYDPEIVKVLEKLHPKLEHLVEAQPRSEKKLYSTIKVERGSAPEAGLLVERPGDASVAPALNAIIQARQELQILYELSQALGNSLSLDETLRLLVEQLRKLIDFDASAIYLIEEGKLVPRFVEGVNAALLAGVQAPLGEGLSGWVAGTGNHSLNGNPAVEPGYMHDPKRFSDLRSALSVPLDSAKGIIGALTLYSLRHEAFTLDHLRILKAIGMKVGSTIYNLLIHEAIGKSAGTDPLTELPNARALAARLEQEAARAARQQTPYSLFVLDMNGLKKINDTLGHSAGDKALVALAGALRGCLREYDFVARMGGDEFVLLLPGMGVEDASMKRLDLAVAVKALNKDLPGLEISVSLGSASYPNDGLTTEKLLAVADHRMYWHKRYHHGSRARSQGLRDGTPDAPAAPDSAAERLEEAGPSTGLRLFASSLVGET